MTLNLRGPARSRREGFWVGGCEQYCQRIMSAPIRRGPRSPRSSSPTSGISRPRLVEELLVRENAPVRRATRQRDRQYERDRVEPQPICSRISETQSAGNHCSQYAWSGRSAVVSPLPGTSRIALPNVLRALPSERREGDNTRIEPGIADLCDAAHLRPAARAGDRHRVDPRSMASCSCSRPERARTFEPARSDHRQRVARPAGIEGQREPEVPSFRRDIPVAHVPEPVVHALRVERPAVHSTPHLRRAAAGSPRRR